MKALDIAAQPGAFLAAKRPLPITVEFAERGGTLDTREGAVRYQAGDAILTGVEGERWPVERARFLASYDPATPLREGENGSYVKRHRTVWAWRSSAATEIALSGGRGSLRANAGDVIIDYGGGDLAVVAPSIFERSYQRMQALPESATEHASTPGVFMPNGDKPRPASVQRMNQATQGTVIGFAKLIAIAGVLFLVTRIAYWWRWRKTSLYNDPNEIHRESDEAG